MPISIYEMLCSTSGCLWQNPVPAMPVGLTLPGCHGLLRRHCRSEEGDYPVQCRSTILAFGSGTINGQESEAQLTGVAKAELFPQRYHKAF